MIEKRYRDAVTGEYVTPEYAADHPDTTVAETAGWTPGNTNHPTAERPLIDKTGPLGEVAGGWVWTDHVEPDPAAGEVAGDVESGWLDPADPDTTP